RGLRGTELRGRAHEPRELAEVLSQERDRLLQARRILLEGAENRSRHEKLRQGISPEGKDLRGRQAAARQPVQVDAPEQPGGAGARHREGEVRAAVTPAVGVSPES